MTPLIGLSLAALVAGSLITLAVLAQRVTLETPQSGGEVQPRTTTTSGEAPPLVIANEPPPPEPEDRQQRPPTETGDQVLPLRISQPAVPADNGPKKPKDGDRPDPDKPKGRPLAAGLPPGIIKKINRGDETPPGHLKRAAVGARPVPPGTSNGRGACGEPPCGNGADGAKSTVKTVVASLPGSADKHGKSHGGHARGNGKGHSGP